MHCFVCWLHEQLGGHRIDFKCRMSGNTVWDTAENIEHQHTAAAVIAALASSSSSCYKPDLIFCCSGMRTSRSHCRCC